MWRAERDARKVGGAGASAGIGEIFSRKYLSATTALMATFGSGFFSGSGVVGSEIFPTRVRARALGVTYNGARTLSAIAPAVIGAIGQRYGLGAAFGLCAASHLAAAIVATRLPETRGKAHE